MMRRVFEHFFSCAALICVLCAGGQAFAASPIRVVVYGDSLTAGYQLPPEESFAAKLKRKLQEIGFTGFEVINMSVVGETTAGGAERFNVLMSRSPDIVIVALGANDTIRGINPDFIYHNLSSIVSRLRAQNTYIVLAGIKAPAGMGPSYGRQLDAVYERIAEFHQIAFYPNLLAGISGRPEFSLADGYHPNSQGVDVMVEGIYRLVDAGLRWKLEALRLQQEYEQQWRQQHGAPASAEPEPPPPAPAE